MKTFDFLNDYEDWRDFVYKIKLRLNQFWGSQKSVEQNTVDLILVGPIVRLILDLNL